MDTASIPKNKLSELVRQMRRSYQVYGPVHEGRFVNFSKIEDGVEIDLSFQNTHLSAKSLFLPQSQRMFAFNLDPANPDPHVLKELSWADGRRAVVGIRPCDARALQLVDVNFDTRTYRDPWWIQARESTTLVGLGCTAPCSTCFCASVGGGPFDDAGLDILLTEVGDVFVAKIFTQKGNDLISAVACFEHAETALVDQAESIHKAAEGRIASRVDTSRLAQLDMLALYEAGFWEDVHFSCINCGTCTFLCPTCWCFDIQDEADALSGIRMRNWDSCMFCLFTRHASGHNPRGEKVHRVRQRFMHKLKYYVDKYGNGIGCVGCGRCVQHCPVNIDIREVIGLMNAYKE